MEFKIEKRRQTARLIIAADVIEYACRWFNPIFFEDELENNFQLFEKLIC